MAGIGRSGLSRSDPASRRRKVEAARCLANYLDCCALTLPCGRDRNGVPVGPMLMAPSGDDERLLRLGYAVEPVLAAA